LCVATACSKASHQSSMATPVANPCVPAVLLIVANAGLVEFHVGGMVRHHHGISERDGILGLILVHGRPGKLCGCRPLRLADRRCGRLR